MLIWERRQDPALWYKWKKKKNSCNAIFSSTWSSRTDARSATFCWNNLIKNVHEENIGWVCFTWVILLGGTLQGQECFPPGRRKKSNWQHTYHFVLGSIVFSFKFLSKYVWCCEQNIFFSIKGGVKSQIGSTPGILTFWNVLLLLNAMYQLRSIDRNINVWIQPWDRVHMCAGCRSCRRASCGKTCLTCPKLRSNIVHVLNDNCGWRILNWSNSSSSEWQLWLTYPKLRLNSLCSE